jgi:hypothetical protein
MNARSGRHLIQICRCLSSIVLLLHHSIVIPVVRQSLTASCVISVHRFALLYKYVSYDEDSELMSSQLVGCWLWFSWNDGVMFGPLNAGGRNISGTSQKTVKPKSDLDLKAHSKLF